MDYRDNAFNLPMHIFYHPPKALLFFISATHTGALCCLYPLALPLCLRLFLMVLLLINYLHFLQEFRRGQREAFSPQLLLNKDNEWSLIGPDNNAMSMILQPGAFVHRLLLVLRFICASGKTTRFILSSENVDRNTLRRLRVRLRHGKRKGLG